MRKISRTFMSAMLILCFVLSLSVSASAAELADGTYTITIIQSTSASSAGLYDKARLDVSGGEMTVYFVSAGRAHTFVDKDGTTISSPTSENGNEKTYKVSIASLDDTIKSTFVAGSSAFGYIEFTITFDKNSVTSGYSASSTGTVDLSGQTVPELSDGEYTVTVVPTIDPGEGGLSTTAKITVKNGEYTATLTSGGRSYVFTDSNGGSVKTDSQADVKITDLGYVMKAYFGNVPLTIYFDASTVVQTSGQTSTGTVTTESGDTATATTALDADAEVTDDNSATTEEGDATEVPATGDTIQNTLTLLLVAFAALITVTVVVNKKSGRNRQDHA